MTNFDQWFYGAQLCSVNNNKTAMFCLQNDFHAGELQQLVCLEIVSKC